MKQGLKAALIVLGVAFAAAPFWVSLTIPFEDFTPPPGAVPEATGTSIATDLARWDAATPAARRAAAEDVARRLPDFALLHLETFSCGGQTHEVAIYRHARTEMEFVLVPGGTFTMGSDESPFDDKPHAVTLTHAFLVARTETTQAAWKLVMGTDPSAMKGADRPVELVSWNDATAFCGKAGLDLPTDAQWERACRAGTTWRFHFGDDPATLAEYGWYESNPDSLADFPGFVPTERHGPHPVGRLKPNALGLFDMLGNVNEWCADMRGSWSRGAETDPLTPSDGTHRYPVYRGGCWSQRAENCRSAFHLCLPTDARQNGLGFRPAKTVPLD